ncbi:hypothetical protein AB0E55_37485 [Amycolatopsis keratiniphila]|uniref:hypothetical protein n=1 Tax=Amycolatopsis keratiniphila TaxID=129921 RepID=UPI0033DB1D2F
MSSEKLVRAGQVSGALAPVSLLVTYLNFAYNTGAWPYGTQSWIWILAGALVALAGMLYPLILLLRRHNLRPWPLALCLALTSTGSVIASVSVAQIDPPATAAPGAPLAPAALDIDSPKPRARVSGEVSLTGHFSSPLRPGETMWVFVSNGEAGVGDSSTHYLQLGPCSVDRADSTWSCPDVTLVRGPAQDRIITLSLVSAEAEQARLFVRQLADGAQLQQRNADCEARGCAKDGNRDPRNYSGLPGGSGVTFLDSRTVVLSRGK